MHSKLTAAEFSGISGIEKRTINRWARDENWPTVQDLAGGLVVRKFVVALLPDERRQQLAAPPVTSPGKSLAILDDDLPKLSELKGWQRKVMDARVALFREFQRLEAKYGTSRAMSEFIRQSRTGGLPAPLQALVPVANARSGKGDRGISKSTINRWKAMDCKGLAAFAPKDIEKKEIPPWANFFMRCYQIPSNPSMPEAMEEMAKILPEGMEMPSYHQVRRFHDKRSRLDRERGRKTGSEFKALRGCRQRDTSQFRPCDIGVCDGHSFKAKVAHPIHGKPFKPEICAVIDAATRMIVGWSTGLAESALTVADAVRHAATVSPDKPYGGVFNILYTDGGAGNEATVNTDEFVGLFPRLGTTHMTGIAGNAQARGLIERLNKSLWIRAAKKLPTYMGRDMDKLTGRNVYLLMEKDFRQSGKSDVLISWPQFLSFCGDEVDAYNRRPHSSLPKFTDQTTGRKRHMCPMEAWVWHMANGWRQEDHLLSEQEVEILFRPRIKRTIQRSAVSLFNNTYYNKALEHYEGEELAVGYDIHDGTKVQIWDRSDRLICYAIFEQNKDDYFPVSMVEKAANDRARRRAKIKLDNLAEIEAERRGIIDIEPSRKVIDISSAPSRIRVDKASLVLEMAATETFSVPEDDKGKYLLWNTLDTRLASGETLERRELLFYEAYRKSASYRAFRSVADTLGQDQARQ